MDLPKATAFLSIACGELERFGGYLIQYKSKAIGPSKALGEFMVCDNKPVIKLSTSDNLDDWCSILLHEYCHFLQWRSHAKTWKSVERLLPDGLKSLESLSEEVVFQNTIKKIIKLEREADLIACDIIEKYQLDLNIELYCRQSNLVLFKWMFFRRYKTWPKSNKKETDALLAMCPSRMIGARQQLPSSLATTLLGLLKQ